MIASSFPTHTLNLTPSGDPAGSAGVQTASPPEAEPGSGASITVEAQPWANPPVLWVASVGGRSLKTPRGRTRMFVTEKAAREAAEREVKRMHGRAS